MKKHFFTLVELLVVIGIIAILAGLILAGVTMARANARETECQSNQKETGKFLQAAINDNRSFLVSGTKFGDSPGKEAAWTRYLYGGDLNSSIKGRRNYASDMAVLRCPLFKYSESQTLGALDATKREASLKEAYGLVYSSSVDDGAGFAGFDFRGSKFEKFGTGSSAYNVAANNLILGGCASKSAPYDTAGALLYNGSWENKLVKIHSDKCNVFFRDGHVEGLKQTELEQKYLPNANAGDSASKLIKFPSGTTAWIDPDN